MSEMKHSGKVYVEVSGLTGSGKSAVMGEIEIAMKALGLTVEHDADFQAEKNGTHADWQGALDLHKPSVVISERNVSRAASPQAPAREGDGMDAYTHEAALWRDHDRRHAALTPREEAPAEGAGDQGLANDIAAIIDENADTDADGLHNASQLAEKIRQYLRARTSEPEAGLGSAIALVKEGLPRNRGAEWAKCRAAELRIVIASAERALYAHPSPATADKLREETERLVTFGTALCTAADHYGVKHLDSDDMDDEAVQLQAATLSMRHVITDAAQALATLSPKKEGGV